MNCEKYKKLIEKSLDGIISDLELGELKSHCQQCKSCKKELAGFHYIQDFVSNSFASQTNSQQARNSILLKLNETKRLPKSISLFTKQMAAAAIILIAIGLFAGFGLGQVNLKQQIFASANKVPILVKETSGTVLVRHTGSKYWQQMQVGMNIHQGDTFQTAAKAGFALELEDKSTLEINQNSTLTLKNYNGGTLLHLQSGKMHADLTESHPPFVISTPHGRVEALGTEFTVSVE